MTSRSVAQPPARRGFSLVEMIVVTFLLALAMLGLLAVFDASARINKSETEVADAQGAVRYGIYQMTRVIRMAGSGGLFVTQAVLNRNDDQPALGGITPVGVSYDNVPSTARVINLAGTAIEVRPNTDMIEIRGVILSPLLALDLKSGCGGCTAAQNLDVLTAAGSPVAGEHINNDAANRPQFAGVNTYTAGATANSMFVLVSNNDDVHGGCSVAFGAQAYPQPTYNVGLLTAPTSVAGTPAKLTFPGVNFASPVALEFNNERPGLANTAPPQAIENPRRAGVLDDIIFFIDNSDSRHPALAQGIRRGTSGGRFDVILIADDVEDMQIAYGVDTNSDDAITRLPTVVPGPNVDPNVSTVAGGDEWVPNVPSDTVPGGPATTFTTADFLPTVLPFPHVGVNPPTHCPRLHGVMISLVAKSRDPDPTYKGPSAIGFRTMNTPVNASSIPLTAIYPPPNPNPNYRRRIQTLKINLRNYAFPGVQ